MALEHVGVWVSAGAETPTHWASLITEEVTEP